MVRSILAISVLVFAGIEAVGGTADLTAGPKSIARVWNEQNLAAIRVDTPHPPVHARNLFHLSVVMYDAWAAYDPTALGYVYRKKELGLGKEAVEAARREAI